MDCQLPLLAQRTILFMSSSSNLASVSLESELNLVFDWEFVSDSNSLLWREDEVAVAVVSQPKHLAIERKIVSLDWLR